MPDKAELDRGARVVATTCAESEPQFVDLDPGYGSGTPTHVLDT